MLMTQLTYIRTFQEPSTQDTVATETLVVPTRIGHTLDMQDEPPCSCSMRNYSNRHIAVACACLEACSHLQLFMQLLLQLHLQQESTLQLDRTLRTVAVARFLLLLLWWLLLLLWRLQWGQLFLQ